jgi:uncharacterized cupin superfamily protein
MVVNVFDDEWEQGFDPAGYVSRLRPLRQALGAERMGASVVELAPGEQSTPYHSQYAEEEWLLVLDSDPTLRTPAGVQTLERGDIVAFRRGAGRCPPSTERDLLASSHLDDLDAGGRRGRRLS